MRSFFSILLLFSSSIAFAEVVDVDCKPSGNTPYKSSLFVEGQFDLDESSDKVEGTLHVTMPFTEKDFSGVSVSGSYSKYVLSGYSNYNMKIYHAESDRDFYSKIRISSRSFDRHQLTLIYNFSTYTCEFDI